MGGAVSYLRLDGAVPAGSRHGIVARFNADPSIDVVRPIACPAPRAPGAREADMAGGASICSCS